MQRVAGVDDSLEDHVEDAGRFAPLVPQSLRRDVGLFAVGQNGLGEQILWGHGLHISWALTSGLLVGKTLAGIKSTA